MFPDDPEISSTHNVKKNEKSDIRHISSFPSLNNNLNFSRSSELNADTVQDIPGIPGKKGERIIPYHSQQSSLSKEWKYFIVFLRFSVMLVLKTAQKIAQIL